MNQTGVPSVRSRRHALRNRRLPCLVSDQNRVAVQLYWIGRHGMDWWTTEHAAGLERKDTFVPGTRHGAAGGVHRTFRQAGAGMGAAVGDRVDGTVHVEERDRLVVRV